MPDYTVEVAQNIRQQRILHDLTQEMLAQKIHKSRQFVIAQEIRCVRIKSLEIIADGLGCDIIDLLPPLPLNAYDIEKYNCLKQVTNECEGLELKIGKMLKRARKIAKYTQLKLSMSFPDRDKISRETISMIEAKGCKSIAAMYAIASALKCPIYILLH